MAWLPDGEKILKICLFILTEFANVTDTWTHRHMASCSKNYQFERSGIAAVG